MISCVHFGERKQKGFPRGKGQRKGSRKWVELSDGSIVKWWNNEWRFSSVRWNSKVTSSLQMKAMSVADENGRLVKDEERYTDFDKFSKRLVAVIGPYDFLRMVEWIKS